MCMMTVMMHEVELTLQLVKGRVGRHQDVCFKHAGDDVSDATGDLWQ